MNVNVKLREYLDTHSISAYRVVQETHGKIAERTVYALARQGVKRVDLETLGEVIGALRRLTGQPVTPNDLLEVIEEPPEEMDSETKAWLDGAAYDMAASLAEIEKDVPPDELKAWLEANRKAAKPVKYIAGVGFAEVTA
jgi:hypothetical protein